MLTLTLVLLMILVPYAQWSWVCFIAVLSVPTSQPPTFAQGPHMPLSVRPYQSQLKSAAVHDVRVLQKDDQTPLLTAQW